jgi:hypothetical protein
MRVVICCDQEAPPELVRDALMVGRALVEKRHSVAYIAGDPVRLVEYAGSWTPSELVQSPVRRPAPDLVMKRPPVDGFADLMATVGFDDKQALITLAAIWDRQLRMLKPDAIIGFNTPVLWLVAPAHAPTFALGNGSALPPALGTSFPRLSVDSWPLADDELMLANANAVLARFGYPAIAALSDILDRCVQILYGVPAFDPYLPVRRALSSGLLGYQPTPTVLPPRQRLAALLDVYCPGIETIVLALAGFGPIPIDVCIAGATTGMRRYLEEQSHIQVWNHYAAVLDQLASASAIIHHGMQDVAQRAISLGRPQLLIPWTREQQFFSEMIGWMGFSWIMKANIPIHDMTGTLRAFLPDASLTIAAQHHARQLANSNLPDALPGIVEQIEKAKRS